MVYFQKYVTVHQCILALVVLLFFPHPILALENTVRYKVESRYLHYQPEKNIILLRRDVVITTEKYKVYSDEADVLLQGEDEPQNAMKNVQIKTIHMRKNVRFSYTKEKGSAPITGKSQRAEYDAINSVIYMYGSAQINAQGNIITGEEIRFSLPTGAVEVKGATQRPVVIEFERKNEE